jgi:CheY-like chemotaxis protein
VSDTGSGLSTTQQARLAEEYQRFKSGVRGTGLGLSIVRQILGHMRAELEVHSSPDRGSNFEFEIDAPQAAVRRDSGSASGAAGKPDEQRTAAEPSPDQVGSSMPAVPAGGSGPLPLALVIDDDADLGLLLAACLERQGWRSEVWQAWSSAAVQANGMSPQAVLIDLNLGEGASGLELIERARHRWPEARVIGMSADRSQHVRDHCLQAGAQTFVGKPISEHELARLLHRVGRADVN